MADPLNPDPRAKAPVHPAADPTRPDYDPAARVDNRTVVQSRGSGTSVMIAAVVIILAIVAYFMFSGGDQVATPDAPSAPTATEPATPAPAPAEPTPTEPATPPATEPPADAAPAPAPAEPAPAPAEPTTPPAEPAPAQ